MAKLAKIKLHNLPYDRPFLLHNVPGKFLQNFLKILAECQKPCLMCTCLIIFEAYAEWYENNLLLYNL